MTENKRFTIQSDSHAEEIKLLIDKEQMVMWSFLHHDEAVNSICDLLNELNDENEQLKSTIKEVTELLSDEVDLFSDKAIEHDINAYIELNELDNKDAYYMAKATKTAIKMLKGDVE